MDLGLPAGRQFVQQAIANLTLQLKGNVRAGEKKRDKFVDIFMRVTCLHAAENPKEERLKFARAYCCLT